MRSDEILRAELESANAEYERLRKKNADLRLRFGEPPHERTPIIGADFSLDQKKAQLSATVMADSRPELKVSLFRSLFRGGMISIWSGGRVATVEQNIPRRVFASGAEPA